MAHWSRLRLTLNAERLRRVFWALAIPIVFLNLADDGLVYFRHINSEKEDSWVRHQFLVRNDFERLVTLFFNGDWSSEATRAEAQQLRNALSQFAEHDPQVRTALTKMEQLMDNPPSPKARAAMSKTREVFRNMRALLDRDFHERLDGELTEGMRTQKVILVSNIVDLAMILVLLGMYFLERSIKDNIENSLAKSVDDLRASNERLEEITRARNRQLKTAAHDLKTPLAALKGFSELARDTATKDAPIARLLQRIDSLTNASLEMANSLFSDPGLTPPATVFDAGELVREVTFASLPLVERKKQILQVEQCDSASLIRANRSDLLICLHNLVGNAIKFSPPKTCIHFHCTRSAGRVTISLRDEGPGFQPEDFARMFEPGRVLSARPTGGETSTGYGLYSAKNIIESNGGTLSVRTPEGGGALIEITFTLERAMVAAPRDAAPV